MPLRLHAWTVFVGSALVFALLCAIAPDFGAQEARYAQVQVGDARCLVDEASGTFASGTEAAPPCGYAPPRRALVASAGPVPGWHP